MRRIALGSQAVITGTVSAVLAALCEEAGLKAIPLRTSDEVTGPVLYGFRPAVLLPEGWLDLLSADDLRALLAHEVAHAKRRDLLANLLQRLVEAPLFFHPGAWLASRRVTAAREEMCDAWALSRGLEAGAYAKALASAADRAQRPLPVAVLGLTEAKSTLLRRVEAIMQGGSLKRLSRPLVVALIGIALVSAVAFARAQVCGEPSETTIPTPTSGGTVALSGRVVDEEGRPVVGARLRAYGFESHTVFLSTTGDDGRFSIGIPRLAAGGQGWGDGWIDPSTCRIIAHKPGLAMGWVQRPGGTPDDDIIDVGDIRLGRPASVSGVVRDVEGVLLSRVLVRAESVEEGGEKLQFGSMGDFPTWLEAYTDERGRYTISDLPANASIRLEVSLCGAGECYRADEMGPDLGSIDLAKQRGPVDIQLVRQPRIQGRLVTEEGEPAVGVTVRLSGPEKGNPRSIFGEAAVTDENGRYEFKLILAGTWILSVTTERYAQILAQDLTVDLGDSVDLGTTVLARSATIEGRVLDAATGRPVEGAYVSGRARRAPDPGIGVPPAVTDADGRFTVSALPGEVVLSVGGPKGYTGNQRVTTETVDGQTFVRITSDPDKPPYKLVTIGAGKRATGVVLYVTPSATVAGVVLGPDSKPWRYGGHVSIEIDRERVKTNVYPVSGGNVGIDGAFSAPGLHPSVPVVAALYDEERELGGGARFTPKVGAPTDVIVEMRPLAMVVGRVLMPDGRPAAGVDVGFIHVHGRTGSVFATTGADGSFSMDGGIVGTVCGAIVVVPSIRERDETGAELRLRGFTKVVPVTSSDQVIDLGDIVLEPYDPHRAD
jgi:5-hydroxyisourate hydrolase-like protein (transthyretin family)